MSESKSSNQGDGPWKRLRPTALDFEEFIDSRASVALIHDEQLEKRDKQARAQLRSVPLLRDFGFNTVVHTETWSNQFKLVDYNHVPSQDVSATDSEPTLPVVHVTTQEGITEYGEEDLVWDLVQNATRAEQRYILVTDTRHPRLPSRISKPGKSLTGAVGDVTILNYNNMVDEYVDEYFDSELPLAVSKNTFFHYVSEFHAEREAPADDLPAIFDYTRAPPESPVWEPLYYFIEHDLEAVLEDLSERIREALRSWVEKGDTTRIASSMYDTLSVNNFDVEELDNYRTRDPELR